jgi:hypothetical protein
VEEMIVREILYKGLADSTFREKFPEAYKELLFYQEDLEASARKILKREFKAALKGK